MSSYSTFFSPAKLNLFFHVSSKRQDGYHEIASLYQAINFGDFLHIKLSKHALNEDKFKVLGLDIDLKFDSSNLIYKAVDIFRKKSKELFSVDIVLEKNIPVQAGLGGGSSNAATVLFALNKLLDEPFAIQDLLEMGKELGSDVNFFFSSGSAFCTGRGEIFEEMPYKKYSFVLAKPSFGMSTVDVYRNVKIDALEGEKRLQKAVLSYEKGDFLHFFNDLEKSAFSINPELFNIKDRLLNDCGFKKVVMTGSGSCFICFGESLNKDFSEISFFEAENVRRNSKNWYSGKVLS